MEENAKIFLNRAYEIENYLIDVRRHIHKNAEIGYDTAITSDYVKAELKKMEITYTEIDNTGIIADIGHGDTTILLRADMDALPMYEINDLPFKSVKKISHCCGHDLHTAMLIGAAKILKENENNLKRKIRLMFQPGEEDGTGAKRMIEKGILDDGKIEHAIALHVDAKSPLGLVDYGYGNTFSSNDNFEIIIHGKGGHGARSYETIDPISIAFNIYNGLNSIINREIDPFRHTLFSITSVEAESTYNIIPDAVKMKGTLRTYNEDERKYLLQRFEKTIEMISNAFMADSEFLIRSSVPSLNTSKKFTDEVLKIISNFDDRIRINEVPIVKRGSEDFSYVTEKIGSNAYLFIGAGRNKYEGYEYGQHNSNVIFNEDVLPLGAALLSFIAFSKKAI